LRTIGAQSFELRRLHCAVQLHRSDHSNVADNLYFNKNAFSTSAANTFGNAPRTLPDVYSP